MFTMKTITKMVMVIMVISVSFVQAVTMQGVLRDPLGRTVDDGFYSLTFRMYDAQTGGDALWNETQGSVNVKHGVFAVDLGSVTSMSGLTFATQYFVGISVEEGPELEPRIKLASVPNAMAVLGVDNVFPSSGNVGVGTNIPEAGLHILPVTAEQDLLVIDNENGGKISFDKDGNLNVHNGAALKFSDGSSMTSADMGGSASGVASDADVNITSTGGSINFNIGDSTIATVNADGSTAGFGGFDDNTLELGGYQETSGFSSLDNSVLCSNDNPYWGWYGSAPNSNYIEGFCGELYPPAETVETIYPAGKPNANYQGSSFIDVDIHASILEDNLTTDGENQFYHPYRVDPSATSTFSSIVIKPLRPEFYSDYYDESTILYPGSSFMMGYSPQGVIGIYPMNPTNSGAYIGSIHLPFAGLYANSITRSYDYNLSDRSVKENINDLDLGLHTIMDLRPVRYDINVDKHPLVSQEMRDNPSLGYDNLGFIAQELQEVIPEMVVMQKDVNPGKTGDLLMVKNWEQMTAVLVKAMQELKTEKDAEIDMLLERIKALENK